MFKRAPIVLLLAAILAVSTVNCGYRNYYKNGKEAWNYDEVLKVKAPNEKFFQIFQNQLLLWRNDLKDSKYKKVHISNLHRASNEFKKYCVMEFAQLSNGDPTDAALAFESAIKTMRSDHTKRFSGGQGGEYVRKLNEIFKKDPVVYFLHLNDAIMDLLVTVDVEEEDGFLSRKELTTRYYVEEIYEKEINKNKDRNSSFESDVVALQQIFGVKK